MDLQKVELVPLRDAVAQVTDRKISPATLCRWGLRGVKAGPGDPVRLRVQYVGRIPCTTVDDVRKFFADITEAKLSQSSAPSDVTPVELESAGLAPRPRRKAGAK